MIKAFIIIDDDSFTNTMSGMIVKKALGADVDIHTFSIPEEGLSYIDNEYSKDIKPAILLLDINMPGITGWEFLEEYEKFSEDIKKHIRIYMLSSSLDQRDRDRADANKYVKGFISKPLNQDYILSIATDKWL